MALTLINTQTITSPVSSVSITGIDATYPIYRVIVYNARIASGSGWQMRWLVGGTPETGNNHYSQWHRLRYQANNNDILYGGIATDYRYSGNDRMYIGDGGVNTGDFYSAKIDLYKAYDSDSEGRFALESIGSVAELRSFKGGGYRKAKQQYNGIQIFSSVNIESGTFNLYGYDIS